MNKPTTAAELHNPLSLRVAEHAKCPACSSGRLSPVIKIKNVPANSCLMLDSAAEARAYPRGDIDLIFCEDCGFIFNRAFDPLLTEYSERYEPTQAYSPTFNRFHKTLAERLVTDLDLHGKQIVEIGCGQGEFLHLMCSLGKNTGVGFDPCLDQRREDAVQVRAEGGVKLIGRFFSDQTIDGLSADLLASKMTLEHIPAAGRFAETVKQVALQSKPGMRIFIQIPESDRILRDCAFEDIYYEHCNYFTEPSLTGLFARNGFKIDNVTREYAGQYLANIGHFTGEKAPATSQNLKHVRDLVEHFKAAFAKKIADWNDFVVTRVKAGKRVIIWGSGSKGVSFLHALSPNDAISHVVDINPHRQGKFMVGTGHPIVGPKDLVAIKPDTVVVMNTVYTDEIREILASQSLRPELVAL